MTKLWQKSGSKLHPLVEAYTVGDDWKLDEVLIPYDIQASLAHAQMLAKIGILSKKELSQLSGALKELLLLAEKGKLPITVQDEDCHTVIENMLVKKVGAAGKKIHTGRSRNDQVLVALRLFMKDNLKNVQQGVSALSKTFLAKAKKHKNTPFPGYSHTQQAMLSSLGLYFGAFHEALGDDAALLKLINVHIDQNPLGSAAGYGVALPLDRKMTTQLLGFKKVQNNAMYCQNSRGKFESLVVEGLVQVMLTLSRFASDMLFFTSRECGYFSLSDAVVTGSSIMPQKRNADPLEILRGKTSVLISHQSLIQNLISGLLSGYHRDLQLLKKPLIESFSIVEQSIEVISIVLAQCEPNEKIITSKIAPDIFAADIANELVQKEGMAFRDAYNIAMEKVKTHKLDFAANIKSKISPGAPGNLAL